MEKDRSWAVGVAVVVVTLLTIFTLIFVGARIDFINKKAHEDRCTALGEGVYYDSATDACYYRDKLIEW